MYQPLRSSTNSLTPLGLAVGQRVAALADWIELNLPDILDAQRLKSGAAD